MQVHVLYIGMARGKNSGSIQRISSYTPITHLKTSDQLL